MLVFVVRTSASDCLDDRLQNDLQCVEQGIKHYSLIHPLIIGVKKISLVGFIGFLC